MPHTDEDVVAWSNPWNAAMGKLGKLGSHTQSYPVIPDLWSLYPLPSRYQVAHTNQYPEGDQGHVLSQSRDVQLLQHEIIETPRISGRTKGRMAPNGAWRTKYDRNPLDPLGTEIIALRLW